MKKRRAMVDSNDTLSMRRQCELLGVNRSSLYYVPVEPDSEELQLMRCMDEIHLEHPSFGSRMLTQMLKRRGHVINRKRVQRLMRLMGLESTAPKPSTSKPSPEHPVYPYLLRNKEQGDGPSFSAFSGNKGEQGGNKGTEQGDGPSFSAFSASPR